MLKQKECFRWKISEMNNFSFKSRVRVFIASAPNPLKVLYKPSGLCPPPPPPPHTSHLTPRASMALFLTIFHALTFEVLKPVRNLLA